MANEITVAVIIVSGIGLIIGLVLAIVSIVMAVPKNEKEEAVREALPGANCGGCGFSGCDAYAKAIVEEGAGVSLCPVGGSETAAKLAELMGVEAEPLEKTVAVVRCMGNADNAPRVAEYQGIESCKGAMRLSGSLSTCGYGCIGLGDCVKECDYNALTVCNGVARVITENCRGCGACTRLCPKELIALVPFKEQAVVRCRNFSKGAVTRKECSTGCIGCMKCVKECPTGAVEVTNFVARVDPKRCTLCGKCLEACPVGCITPLKRA